LKTVTSGNAIQAFARKLIRISNVEDVQNEIRAVDKLCKPGGKCKNIVVVLRHGKVPTFPFYYFDMELCDVNLETFAKNLWKPAPWEEILMTGSADIDIESRMKQVWAIMCHVANGVRHIHIHQEVHRDIKPENSMTNPWHCS